MIRDIDDVRKRLMQAWFDFEQDIMDAVIDQWRDCLRSCSEMNVYLYDLSKHFMKLSV